MNCRARKVDTEQQLNRVNTLYEELQRLAENLDRDVERWAELAEMA